MARSEVTPFAPLRFEGSVALAAPRHRVWQRLTDPKALAQFTPGLNAVHSQSPINHTLQQHVTLGGQSIPLTSHITWRDIVPPDSMGVSAELWLNQRRATVSGDIWLTGETDLRFAIACVFADGLEKFPRPLLHSVATQIITQFLRNLKRSVEQPSSGDGQGS